MLVEAPLQAAAAHTFLDIHVAAVAHTSAEALPPVAVVRIFLDILAMDQAHTLAEAPPPEVAALMQRLLTLPIHVLPVSQLAELQTVIEILLMVEQTAVVMLTLLITTEPVVTRLLDQPRLTPAHRAVLTQAIVQPVLIQPPPL